MDAAFYRYEWLAEVNQPAKLPKNLDSLHPTVLVVEDDADAREMLGSILEHEGYRVVQAANGRQAFERLETSPYTTELIVLDLDMPIMNGWEFLDRFALQSGRFAAKIVVMTGREQKPFAGVSAVFRKPVDVPHFLELVRQLV
jgi:CheY-like chemotaxis protein